MTDSDFAKATSGNVQTDESAAQNPAQSDTASDGLESHDEPPAHEKTPGLPGFSTPCGNMQGASMGDIGLETPTQYAAKTVSRDPSGAECGALGGQEALLGTEPHTADDAELKLLVDSWPTLPEAIRAGILAMIRAASGAK